MLVTKENILLFGKAVEGERILDLMSQENMECTIVPSRNFSFDCKKIKAYTNATSINSYNFDGKKSLNIRSYMGREGDSLYSTSAICEIK